MRFIHKFTILLSALVIISSLIHFLTFDMVFLKNTNSMFFNINEKAANNINERLSMYFAKIEDSLKIIASDSNVWRNQEILDQVSLTMPEVDTIFILDKYGHVLLNSQNNYASDINLAQQDYFQYAIKGETYISPVVSSIQGLQVIAIATPIIEQGKIEGVVVGTISIKRNTLASLFGNKTFARDAYTVIADNQGTVIFHPDMSFIGNRVMEKGKLQGSSGSAMLRNSLGEEHYVGYKRNTKTNFFTIVYSLTDEVKQLRNMIIYQNLAISSITIVLIVTFGTYTVRRYMRPFEELTKTFSAIRKGQYTEIPSSHHAKEFNEIIQTYNNTVRELEAIHNKLRGDANIDGLTGAYNRRAFVHTKELLDIEMRSSAIITLGIILIDLDNFKNLNDTQGHLAGDDVLKEFTALAIEILAPYPLFRYGGDEFITILRNLPQDTVINLAEQIRLSSEDKLRGCTISIGVATYPENANSLDELLALADQTLYTSKATKNKVTAYPTRSSEDD